MLNCKRNKSMVNEKILCLINSVNVETFLTNIKFRNTVCDSSLHFGKCVIRYNCDIEFADACPYSQVDNIFLAEFCKSILCSMLVFTDLPSEQFSHTSSPRILTAHNLNKFKYFSHKWYDSKKKALNEALLKKEHQRHKNNQ